MPLFRRKRDDEPVDMNARSPQLGVKYKDLMVLDQLRKDGADLSASRHVIYYSYAPSEAVAQAMAREAESDYWSAEVREPLPKFPGQWAVVCQKYAVTSPDFVREADTSFKVSPIDMEPSTTAGKQAGRRTRLRECSPMTPEDTSVQRHLYFRQPCAVLVPVLHNVRASRITAL